MKLKKRTIFIMVLIAISPFLFIPICAQAQDTYNFYFQKAPGPTTVIQGQAPQGQNAIASPKEEEQPKPEENISAEEQQNVVEEKSEDSPSGETKTTQKTEKERKSRWKVGLGVGVVSNQPEGGGNYGYYSMYSNEGLNSSGGAATVEYHINKYVGFGGEVIFPGGGDGDNVNGSLGIVFTPIHINLFGYDFINISVLGGAMSVEEIEYDMFPFYSKRKSDVKAYYGARVAVNLTKDFGLMASYKYNNSSDSEYSHGSLLATWKF